MVPSSIQFTPSLTSLCPEATSCKEAALTPSQRGPSRDVLPAPGSRRAALRVLSILLCSFSDASVTQKPHRLPLECARGTGEGRHPPRPPPPPGACRSPLPRPPSHTPHPRPLPARTVWPGREGGQPRRPRSWKSTLGFLAYSFSFFLLSFHVIYLLIDFLKKILLI